MTWTQAWQFLQQKINLNIFKFFSLCINKSIYFVIFFNISFYITHQKENNSVPKLEQEWENCLKEEKMSF